MKLFRFLFVVLIIMQACKNDDETKISDEIVERNYWVYDVLSEVYLWESQLPTNAKPQIEPDTEEFFYNLLYTDDKWSYITDDYDGLLNALDGVYKDFGFTFGLTYMYPDQANSTEVIGVVEYVLDGSPAKNAGIKRGDIFYKVNGTQLNVSNYNTLLNDDHYTLNFVKSMGTGTYEFLSATADMNAVILEEDPIYDYKVLETGGVKVGYLMYNAFIYSESDSAKLVDVFAYFKEQSVSELVLDLRYNGGGATYVATMLASMMVGEQHMKNKDTFYSYIWNEAYQNYFKSTEGAASPNLRVSFAEMPVNLNLNNLYVLTLYGTASASELIINGLSPYLNVVQIGQTTYGKYTVSIPIPKTDSPDDTWGMLPIVAKSANVNGVTDFKDGLNPDYYIYDDVTHELGDPNEGLLSVALSYINGTQPVQTKSAQLMKKTSIKRFGGNPLLSNGIMISDFKK